MEGTSKKPFPESSNNGGCITSLNDDLLNSILARLPALSFASAACACRSWRRICDSILFSRPKLLSSLSLNPNLQVAVKEAGEKILSEPIRPHFAIAYAGDLFRLEAAHRFVTAKFGTKIPVITCHARGIIGSDAVSNEFREVKWNADDVGENGEACYSPLNVHLGIVLVVGFVPGLKVGAIPLLRATEDSFGGPSVESFLNDIENYTSSVSHCTSPVGIVMFADHGSPIGLVLEKMDSSFGGETVIVGNERGCFIVNSNDGSDFGIGGGGQSMSTTSSSLSSRIRCKHGKRDASKNNTCDAVALVFARDSNKPQGIGEIHLNLALSIGVLPRGPTYKAASVRVIKPGTSESGTWLTARREGSSQILDGLGLLDGVDPQIENHFGDIYIGVVKHRKIYKSRKGKRASSFVLHDVVTADEECLIVEGEGIMTGDAFRFYSPNAEIALESLNDVSDRFRALKNDRRMEVFGGLIFCCYGRGKSFGDPKMVTSPFLENFPGIPLAGMFCTGEIGRQPLITKKGQGELNPVHACLHAYSTVYLVMSYSREPLEG